MQIKRYHNWRGIFVCLVILSCVLSLTALAGTGMDNCPRAESSGANGVGVQFGQHHFPDGSSDLGLKAGSGNDADIKRVTYGGSETPGCRYKSVVLVPGGSEEQWGWHLVWAGEQGLFYARMDGEAWVSSPPKRLSTASASDVELQAKGQELRLTWREQIGNSTEAYQAVSHDEGRSWEAPVQLQSAD